MVERCQTSQVIYEYDKLQSNIRDVVLQASKGSSTSRGTRGSGEFY